MKKARWSNEAKREAKKLTNLYFEPQSQKTIQTKFYTLHIKDSCDFSSNLGRKVSKMHDSFAQGTVILGSYRISARNVEILQGK